MHWFWYVDRSALIILDVKRAKYMQSNPTNKVILIILTFADIHWNAPALFIFIVKEILNAAKHINKNTKIR